MHIQEGFLPFAWCIVWFVISLIVIAIGVIQLKRIFSQYPESKKLLAANGIVMFLVSLLALPSLTGSYSHPTANGLSGSLFGPAVTSVIAAIVLLLQAFLLGYGGFTTLGANIFSIGIVGPFAACIVYNLFKKYGIPRYVSLIVAVLFANLFSIIATALQYTLAFGESFFKFFIILLVSQVPLAFVDVVLAIIVFAIFNFLFGDSEIFSFELNDFFKLN